MQVMTMGGTLRNCVALAAAVSASAAATESNRSKPLAYETASRADPCDWPTEDDRGEET
jgi:hypothetical protein